VIVLDGVCTLGGEGGSRFGRALEFGHVHGGLELQFLSQRGKKLTVEVSLDLSHL
jgi:hypothetical protein